MEPEHHGSFSAVIQARGPNIQIKAILAQVAAIELVKELEQVSGAACPLRARGPVLQAVSNFCPRLGLFCGHESQASGGRGTVGNALERVNATLRVATDFPAADLHDCVGI